MPIIGGLDAEHWRIWRQHASGHSEDYVRPKTKGSPLLKSLICDYSDLWFVWKQTFNFIIKIKLLTFDTFSTIVSYTAIGPANVWRNCDGRTSSKSFSSTWKPHIVSFPLSFAECLTDFPVWNVWYQRWYIITMNISKLKHRHSHSLRIGNSRNPGNVKFVARNFS